MEDKEEDMVEAKIEGNMKRKRDYVLLIFFAIVLIGPYSCGGSGGSGSATTPSSNQAPTASITANPTSIQAGQSTRISWQTNGGTVDIPGIGSNLPANGSQSVSPPITTTYTLTLSPMSGPPVVASVTVDVTNAMPWKLTDESTFVEVRASENMVTASGWKIAGDLNAVAAAFYESGTPAWLSNDLPGRYVSSSIIGDRVYLYRIDEAGSPFLGLGDIYLDIRDFGSGALVRTTLVRTNARLGALASDGSTVFVMVLLSETSPQIYKMDPDGNMLPGDFSAGNISASGIYASQGTIWVTGYLGTDIIIVAFSTSGHELWRSTYYARHNTFDFSRAVMISSGIVYVSGYTLCLVDNGPFPPFLLKYDPGGNLLGIIELASAGETGFSMTSGPNGDIFIPMSDGTLGPKCITSDGVLRWTGSGRGQIANAYFQGKVITADDGPALGVYDASTGARLY